MPESPVWLMRKERENDARKVLQWLRGRTYNIEPEMKELEVVVSEEKLSNESSSFLTAFSDRTFLMPLMISCTLFIIQGFCGCDLMSYYAITMFEGYGIHENLVAIIYQVLFS